MSRRGDDALHAAPELADALAGWRDRGRLSNEAVRALRSRGRRVKAGAAGGLCAVLLAIGFVGAWPGEAPDRVAALQTARGETRAVRLPDGTMLRLDGASRLTIRYGASARDVTLATGAAFFDVAYDPARPFTVRAGDGAVRVLGTAFDVDRTAGRMEVAVYRGAVRLAGRDDPRGEWVPAGWRGHVVRGHASPAVRFDARSDDRRHGWLEIEDVRLADLVTMLNRRSGPMIQPPPVRLGDLKISGRFRTEDPQSLLADLAVSYDFSVNTNDGIVTISQD